MTEESSDGNLAPQHENAVEAFEGDAARFEEVLAEEFEKMWSEVKSKFKGKGDLKLLTHIDSQEKLENLIEKVRKDAEKHHDEHSKRLKGFTAGLQKVCATMSQLLGEYSGIGDIVKSLNTDHGGPLAYGIFSLLLKVSVFRSTRPERLLMASDMSK